MSDKCSDDHAIFNQAIELNSEAERSAYLDKACQGNPRLRQRIEALLRAHADAGSFLWGKSEISERTEIRPRTESRGDVIGPYKLLQQIGEGGMGTVFMAEQTEPVERRVALKIIKPGMDTRQIIARFEAERQALAMMDHPNIAKVLDAGTTGSGRPYFVMELVKGVPITDYCDEQHLTPKERLELFIPICQAVQHAHQKGIIHRDLKPTNILVAQYDNKPVPKVIDFGVAKAISHKLTEKTMFTRYGQIVGTVEYMSPEQARFNQLDVDTRSDIYSLGVLLYELLTGETPFDKQRLRSAAFDELLKILREEDPPRPSTRLSTSQLLPGTALNRSIAPGKLSMLVRGELDWIVMKALEKDRGRRYETASAFAQDVQHYLHNEAVTACPPSVAYKFRKFARRNKAAIAATSAVAASLIIGSSAAIWQAVEAGKERDQARIAEGNAVREAGRAARAEELAEQRLAIVSRQKDEIDEARKRADREASIAKAVNHFLNRDLLGMADSRSQVEGRLIPDPNIKLRTVLDRAANRIDGRFADEPLLEAAIRNTIGETYDAIGEYTLAEEQMQRALKLRQQVLGRKHSLTLTSVNNLAYVYNSQGRFAEAEKLYQQTLAIRRRTLGENHPDTLTCMHNLAGVYGHQHRYDEAEQLNKQALAIHRRTLGDDHLETLKSRHNLALIYREQGRYDEAEQLFRKTLEVQKRTLGDDHPFTLCCMHNLSRVMDHQGRFPEAERLNRQTLEIRRRTLGEEHPVTLRSMHTLALVVFNQHRYDEAEQLNRQTLEIRRRTLGEQAPDTLSSMNNLALVLGKQNGYDEAEQLHQEILAIRRRTLGEEHAETLRSIYNLANLYQTMGRFADAERLLNEHLTVMRRKPPETELALADVLMRLGSVKLSLQKFGEAEPILRESLRISEAHDPDSRLARRSKALLGTALLGQRRCSDAEPFLAETLTRYRHTLGEEHACTLNLMKQLALCHLMQRDYAAAEPLCVEALSGQRRVLGEDHCETSRSKVMLAQLYQATGRFDEAGDLLEELVATAPRRHSAETAQFANILQRQVTFYETRATAGDADRAERYRTLLESN